MWYYIIEALLQASTGGYTNNTMEYNEKYIRNNKVILQKVVALVIQIKHTLCYSLATLHLLPARCGKTAKEQIRFPHLYNSGYLHKKNQIYIQEVVFLLPSQMHCINLL